jgi:hypothetical protein
MFLYRLSKETYSTLLAPRARPLSQSKVEDLRGVKLLWESDSALDWERARLDFLFIVAWIVVVVGRLHVGVMGTVPAAKKSLEIHARVAWLNLNL